MTRLNLDDRMVLAGSAFAAGLFVGMFGRGAARQMFEAVRSRGANGRTARYDNNLPDQLERREPAGGRPRFGGTGALGVSPAVVAATHPEQVSS
jgi:hypothetical protein